MSWSHNERSSFLKVLIILAIALLFNYIQTDGYTINRLGEVSKTFQYRIPSISDRFLMWKSAWEIIKNAPLIGTGIGTYFIVAPAVRHIHDVQLGYFLDNDFLQFWLETGFIGLSLMALIMFATIKFFTRVFRHKDLKLQDRLEITGLMAGLFAVVTHSLVDFNFYIIYIIMII